MKTALNLTVAVLTIAAFVVMLNLVLAGREQHRSVPCNGTFVCLVRLDASQVQDVR